MSILKLSIYNQIYFQIYLSDLKFQSIWKQFYVNSYLFVYLFFIPRVNCANCWLYLSYENMMLKESVHECIACTGCQFHSWQKCLAHFKCYQETNLMQEPSVKLFTIAIFGHDEFYTKLLISTSIIFKLLAGKMLASFKLETYSSLFYVTFMCNKIHWSNFHILTIKDCWLRDLFHAADSSIT